MPYFRVHGSSSELMIQTRHPWSNLSYACTYICTAFLLVCLGGTKVPPKWLYHSHSSSWQIFLDTSHLSSRFFPILGIKSYIILTCILNACLCISSCACWTSTFVFLYISVAYFYNEVAVFLFLV